MSVDNVRSRPTLSEICDRIDYGFTASASSSEVGPRFLRITDIQNGSVDWSKVPFAAAGNRDIRQFMLRPGDIVFARTGATTGKSFLIRICPENAIFASYLIRVRPGPAVDPRYLAYFFDTPDYWAQIQREAQGAGQPGVNASKLERLTVPVPPLSEQIRIADILDKAGIVTRKRRDVESIISSFPRQLFNVMFGNVVANDRGWPSLPVADAGDVQLGRQRSPKYQTARYTRPYLRVANVYDDRLDLSDVLSMDFDDRDYKTYRLESGDILLNEGQSTELVGRAAMWRGELDDCCFQNTLIRFRARTGITNPEYALGVFREYLHRGAFARVSTKTSNVAHLGAARFAAMPFPLPSKEQQDRFAEIRKKLHAASDVAHQAAADADALFMSLTDRAFRGELSTP